MTRVLTGLALGAATWALIFLAPRPLFLALAAALAVLGLREFYRLALACGIDAFRKAGYLAALLWLLVPGLDIAFFLTALALALLGGGSLSRRSGRVRLAEAAVSLAGVLYVAGPLALGTLLHAESPHWLVFVILVNAVGDSIGFFAGKAFGRHPLAPRTSPAKTWEGAIASALCGTLAGALYAGHFLGQAAGPVTASLLALTVNCFAQGGDLAESALKRAGGLKDSGALLPGHGGVLDRIDGILFSMPVVYGFVRFLR